MSTIFDLVQLVNQFAGEAQRHAQSAAALQVENAELKKKLEEATKSKE